jgi:hypothetical protein
MKIAEREPGCDQITNEGKIELIMRKTKHGTRPGHPFLPLIWRFENNCSWESKSSQSQPSICPSDTVLVVVVDRATAPASWLALR